MRTLCEICGGHIWEEIGRFKVTSSNTTSITEEEWEHIPVKIHMRCAVCWEEKIDDEEAKAQMTKRT